MRKITKLLLTAALLIVGVSAVNAAEVKIPIELTGAVSGVTVTPIDPSTLEPLAEAPEHIYAAKFTTSDQLQNVIQIKNMSTADAVAAGCDRIIIEFGEAAGSAWRFHSYGGQFDGIEEIGGETTHTLLLDGDKDIDDFTIFNWLGSGVQEIIVKAAYFYKESDTRTLPVDLSALPASSENTTWAWNSGTSTGTFAWSDKSYNSTQLFGAGNYSAYTTLNLVTATGEANHFRIIIKFSNGADQVTINPISTGTVSLTLSEYTTKENLAFVQTIRLSGANDVTGDITVSSIYLEGPNVTYIEASEIIEAPTGTTDLDDLTGTNKSWNVTYPKTLSQAEVLCGDGNGDAERTHVTITGNDYIHFYVTNVVGAGQELRVWIWDGEAGGEGSVKTLYAYPIADYKTATWTTANTVSTTGTYVVNVSGYNYLKGVKTNWGGSANSITVSQAYVSSGDPVDYIPSGKYTLVGEATGSVSLTAALTDANATSYDARGVTGSGVDLTSVANPNALFIANAGVLANTDNVIVSGVCDNLVLTDNHPFKAPADFTATAASYNTTINTTAQCGTLCLPFAATIPGGVTAYTLSYVNGSDAATLTPVETTITANTPVLLNGSGAATFTGSGAVVAGATNVSGALTGVFANTVVPLNSYVLQNGASGIGFYKVASDITAKPFRAYLTGEYAGSKEFLSFNFDDATGVNSLPSMESSKFNVQSSKIYNLAGQRLSKLQKGLNIVNGKKVMVK